MRLLYPEFLWLLVPLALFALLRYREERAFGLPIHPRLILQNRRTLWVRLAPFIALAWMLLALARPVTVADRSEEAPGLSTLYLAIDASRSMRGRDKRPDRYRFAKAAVERLVAEDKRHRFALLAFTTHALLLTPPTADAHLVRAALEAFNPDFVLTRGTSLKALVKEVARLAGEEKELVIFSDGGDAQAWDEVRQMARKEGIRIDAVACATDEGSKIPSDEGGWLRDERGHLVISTLNPRFEKLARETGGVFVDEATPEAVAAALHKKIARQEADQTRERVRYREYFWLPLGIGVLFFLAGTLGLETLTGRQKRTRRAGPLAFVIKKLRGFTGHFKGRGPWAGVFVALMLFSLSEARAGWLDLWRLQKGYEAYRAGDFNASRAYFEAIDPPLLESTYALANTYYRLGAYKKAGRLYLTCRSPDPQIKAKIWYNLGNCALKLGHYKSARDYYVKALQLGWDEAAWQNLQRILFLQERRNKRVEARANRKVKAQSSSGTADQTKERDGDSGNPQSKMGEGGGAGSASKTTRVGADKSRLAPTRRYQLGSKAYELINRGYVHEKRPW